MFFIGTFQKDFVTFGGIDRIFQFDFTQAFLAGFADHFSVTVFAGFFFLQGDDYVMLVNLFDKAGFKAFFDVVFLIYVCQDSCPLYLFS
jgi:hypothetical protein